MTDFIFLMHGDSPRAQATEDDGAWGPYIEGLVGRGCFGGGSAMGGGACFNKRGAPVAITGHIVGFIRVTAPDLASATQLLAGNPVYEAGGTVEIRALPVTG